MNGKHQRTRADDGHTASARTARAIYLALLGAAAVALVIVVGVAGLADERTGRHATAAGTLTPAETFHDFGRVSMRGGRVSHTFRLRNASGRRAMIGKLFTSCMCTEATLVHGSERLGPYGMPGHGPIPELDRVVEPGEAVTVEATFDPNAHGPAGIGRNERVVTVMMVNQPAVELRFTAYVVP